MSRILKIDKNVQDWMASQTAIEFNQNKRRTNNGVLGKKLNICAKQKNMSMKNKIYKINGVFIQSCKNCVLYNGSKRKR